MTDHRTPPQETTAALSLAALGIVYGDIGTSPLYALRQSLEGVTLDLFNILGVLSLIFWSLTLIISLKYFCIVLRADNNGEGGILALLALLRGNRPANLTLFLILAVFGAGLMLGDGMLTPAISVLSAVEGLNVAAPELGHWIIPIALAILFALFWFQSQGTERIGFIFGPVIFLWFIVLSALGLPSILENPAVLNAINPWYAFHFLSVTGWHGYALLGGVFLVVTGGEALYADIGHLGKTPIRIGWFSVVFPGLLINYFGQGAYLLNHPDAISNPFYQIAPDAFYLPLVFIATFATIIASQAVISATFSLIKQAVLLGLYPHLPIKQTSETSKGQVYIPQMNIVLAIGTFFLIIIFKSSNNLAHAYGIAVNTVMTLTTVMVGYTAYRMWRWPPALVFLLFGFLLCIDFAFLGANLEKMATGGWLPILFALLCATIMATWYTGMAYLRKHYYPKQNDLSTMLKSLETNNTQRLPDTTSIFITDVYDKSGGSFLHFLKLSHALPEYNLIVNYEVGNVPHIDAEKRFTVSCLANNIYRLTLHYGFLDYISIPQSLYLAGERKLLPFTIHLETATYFIEATTIIASPKKKSMWFQWQETLFSCLMRNYSMNLDVEFYQLPHDRTIALGTYCII